MQKYVISISRQFGSLGRPIAKKLAELLEIEYYDRDIVEEASKVHNIPLKEASNLEESAKYLFMSFPLGSGTTATVKDLSLIENYKKAFESNDIATHLQIETDSADESEIADWTVIDGVQGTTDWSEIEIITYKNGIKATTICYWDGSVETSYDEKTTAALANSIKQSAPTTDSDTP